MAVQGIQLMTPTSIVSTGTGNSSSINTNGSVAFSSCATLSLNGVFEANYNNYMIVIRHDNASSDEYISLRWRASGTDASGSDYTYQSMNVQSTTITGARSTSQTSHAAFTTSNTLKSGNVGYVYGPYLAQPTVMRSTGIYGKSNANFEDLAGSHSLSTAYDGFTLIVSATISGLIAVYGMRK